MSLPAPYYDRDGITIYCADCRTILPHLAPVDLVLTDPPYSSGGFQEAGKSGGSIGTRASDVIVADNLSTRGYQRLMREVLRYCHTADEAMIFTDWRMWVYTGDALEDGGWRVRNMLVWDKEQMGMGLPWRNQHELIAYGKKSPAKMMNGRLGNVLRNLRSGNAFHPTEKPTDLLKTLIGNTAAEITLDPFMGSGTTLVAARDLGRQAIGIEICEKYCAIAKRRLAQGVLF